MLVDLREVGPLIVDLPGVFRDRCGEAVVCHLRLELAAPEYKLKSYLNVPCYPETTSIGKFYKPSFKTNVDILKKPSVSKAFKNFIENLKREKSRNMKNLLICFRATIIFFMRKSHTNQLL